MRIPTFSTALLLAGLVAAGSASAHGLWLENRRGNIDVVYGHGPADDAYQTSKFQAVWGFDKSGNKVPVQIQYLESHVRLLPQGNAAVIASWFDNGFYTQRADKSWVNKGRSQVPDAVSSGNYVKYNLAILQSGATLPKNLSQLRLAIIPQKDPTVLKAGDSLPVRVLLDGKPLPGVKITEDYRGLDNVSSFETDSDGRANVVVRNRGLNVIEVGYTLELKDNPDADKLGMSSTLSFVASK